MPSQPCSSQAHLPNSISRSRSVKGHGDRGAGRVQSRGRNQKEKMVRFKVWVRDRGRDRPECGPGTAPSTSEGPQPLGMLRRGVGHAQVQGSGEVCAAPHLGMGTQRRRCKGTKGEGRTRAPVSLGSLGSQPEGGEQVGSARLGGEGSHPRPTHKSWKKKAAGNDPKHCHVLIFLT